MSEVTDSCSFTNDCDVEDQKFCSNLEQAQSLDKLESLIKETTLIKLNLNNLSEIGTLAFKEYEQAIRKQIKDNEQQIIILKEYLLNDKLRKCLRLRILESEFDLRVFDIRIRTKLYSSDDILEKELSGCGIFLFIFSSYDIKCSYDNLCLLNRIRFKIGEICEESFENFVSLINNYQKEVIK